MTRTAILPILIVLLASPSTAQTPWGDSVPARLVAVSRLRVHTADVFGEVERPRLVGDSLTWERGAWWSLRSGRAADPARPMSLADVARLEIRRGTQAGRGAVIGAAVGGALGLAAGIACASDDFFQCDGGDVARATVASAAVVGAIGALIGAAIPRWETLYRRD